MINNIMNKFSFETPINWNNCSYLLIAHIISIYSLTIISTKLIPEILFWYFFTSVGITAGNHRLWSHRSYKAKLPTRFLLMILCSIANQGSIYHWCRDHRTHHKHSDTVADPHNISRGFFYSHMGWLLLNKSNIVKNAGKNIVCTDLLDDWVVKINYDFHPYWNQFWCFIFPGIYGVWRFNSFIQGFLIFGVLRWVLVLHSTWCVNSVAHTYGNRPYSNIKSSESLFTALVANGEGWHNWHHTYPYDYATAESGIFYKWNPTKLFIDILWVFGQTYDHKRKITQNY